MNKLMGFLELNNMKLPSIPWKQYTGGEQFDGKYLWTIRSAVYRGDDMNLPRLIGAKADKAKAFADNLLMQINDKGMVIYYPFFIAKKSGTLCVSRERIVIEAVKDDLCNLVTHSNCEVTILINSHEERIGNTEFLTEQEIDELKKYIPEIKKIFRDDLLEGKSAWLEWSFAYSCDNSKKPKHDEYLVFYEARTIQ